MTQIISIHAPRTGSDGAGRNGRTEQQDFNPRSPHGERRAERARKAADRAHFNPRSPHGERREVNCMSLVILPISTHAPRTGSDEMKYVVLDMVRNFNPRSPHGERHAAHVGIYIGNGISTHAPRTGSDTS